jgi:hypothetical protein
MIHELSPQAHHKIAAHIESQYPNHNKEEIRMYVTMAALNVNN